MSTSRWGAGIHWLFGPVDPVPFPYRLVLFAGGLVALGSIYVATDSAGLQVLVLLGLAYIYYPLAARLLPRLERDELLDAARNRYPPFRLFALWLLGLAALVFLVPDFGLGPWFWFYAVMVPWGEFYGFLARRELRRHGIAGWREVRPLRDSVLAGVVMVPLILPIALFDDVSIGDAVFAGILLGLLVFVASLVFAHVAQRPAESAADEGKRGP